ncbi:Glycine oxidase ThiO [gamma proteobacterium IMCC2047]|nr:Glycine oxidase ThiO [gamma proteobacterium IMCC2047]
MQIGICGAGIMGRLTAWQLLKDGHEVTLFDKDPIDSGRAASYSAAGMLSPYSEAEATEPLVFKLGVASLDLWSTLIKELKADVHYHSGGTLVVAHSQDQGDFTRFSNIVRQRLSAETGDFKQLTQQQVAELEPELVPPFQQAMYMPNEAWLCCCCLMPALADALRAKKVRWFSGTEVLGAKPRQVTVKVRSGERRHDFDYVIDCRGLGAKQQLPELRGVRGELIWLRAPDVKINRLIRLMHPRYRLYIVPRRDDLYLIGATQIESEDNREITVRSTLELLSAAYSIHPGFAEARIVKTDVNLRPALADNQPKIIHQSGLLQVNGLFRHGYLMSPAIAKEVADIIAQGDSYQSPFKGLLVKQPRIDEVAREPITHD